MKKRINMKREFGYTCKCGKFHEPDGYAAAHWDIKLTHTCTECGAVNTIQSGDLLESKKARKRKAKS
jgi:hypothetical protein